jgi:hypothetical protein
MVILVVVLLFEPRGLTGVYERIKAGPIGDRISMMFERKED